MAQAEYDSNAIRARITGASEGVSTTSTACAAHAEFVSALTGHPLRTIPLNADAIDLEDRADHLGEVFGAFSACDGGPRRYRVQRPRQSRPS
jgi:hypothetical protein